MKRYYFHLRDFTGAVFEDEEGFDLPSLAAAKEHALLGLHELVGEAIKGGNGTDIEAIVLADELGTHLAAVPLVMALPPAVVGVLKHPEKIVPKERLEEYRRSADDCRGKAAEATNQNDKVSWLKLADAWLHMLPPAYPAGADVRWPKSSDEDSKASH